MSKITKYINKPTLVLARLGDSGLFNWMSDEQYLKFIFRIKIGTKLNLDNPKTFSEKLQWLKLYDKNPLYTKLVDKYEVKKYVTQKIGKEYVIPTLGVWDKFEDIDFDTVPNQFVIKCTHDCGGSVICKNKSDFDYKNAKKKINKALKRNYFWPEREWPYKNVVPKIILEPYLEDSATKELRDYKFFCFNGKVKALFVATERGSKNETKFDFFDSNYNHLPIKNGHPNATELPKKPVNFEEMKKIASILSSGFCEIRVDLYECNGRVYFGEMTFYHWSGLMPFSPQEYDFQFGEWIVLPNKCNNRNFL